MTQSKKVAEVTTALKKLASGNFSFNHLRVLMALERIVARLEHHPVLSEHLIFKGGFALLKTIESSRFTRDVDALAFSLPKESVPHLVVQALRADLKDGFWFGDVKTDDLMSDQTYGGFRFDCAYQLGDAPARDGELKKLSRIHIDVAFSDRLEVKPKREMMTPLLAGTEPISWYVYPPEQMFAEKLETLCKRASANSRGKDIYDLVILFPRCKNTQPLVKAIRNTFKNRETLEPNSFWALVKEFQPGVLRLAWDGIISNENKISFDKAWHALLVNLRELDIQMVEYAKK